MRDKPCSTRGRIGLLGGSFNPAHEGHLHISLSAMKRLKLNEIWWLASPQNPLKASSELAEYTLRLNSARAVANHPRIRVRDIEAREGLFYSIDTLKFLKRRYPRAQFVWLMGADNLAHFHRWRAWSRFLQLVPIAVIDRAPYALSALHQKFAWRFRHKRAPANAALVTAKSAYRWAYLSLPRHPMSATHLRKTLGKNAFLRHTHP